MARVDTDKEATLREVLGEVSLTDVGAIIKSSLPTCGCMVLFMAIVPLATTLGGAAGFTMPFSVPNWVIGLAATWMYVGIATSERSYHRIDVGWYFPKLPWFASLPLAAYLFGFGYMNTLLWNMELGVERSAWALFAWIVYPAPFVLFLSVIATGHEKLMAKRGEAKSREKADLTQSSSSVGAGR